MGDDLVRDMIASAEVLTAGAKRNVNHACKTMSAHSGQKLMPSVFTLTLLLRGRIDRCIAMQYSQT
eukprot:1091031-Amphidinium_carterae.1